MAKTNRIVYKRHQIFVSVANVLVAPFIRIKTGFRRRRVNIKKHEPFLVVSNHVSAFDPILVTGTLNRQVYYLASELIFSKGFISRVLEYTFAPIPKVKGQSDMASIRTMMQIIKEGGNVGIFVEGNSTMTGARSSVPPGMGKLVKLLKVPLVIFNFHGGYLSNPRWSIKRRTKRDFKGFIRQIVMPEEYASMSADEINDLIVEGINVNAYLETDNNGFPGKHNAEGIHRLLFICPKCHAHNTLYGKNNSVTCTNCSFAGEYDKHGYTHSATFNEAQSTIQLDHTNKLLYQDHIIKTKDFALSEAGQFSEVFRRRRRHFGKATITLSRAGLAIKYNRPNVADVFYPFSQIDSMAIQQKEILVIHINGEQTKMINIKNIRQTSAYQFMIALQILQNIMRQEDVSANEFVKLTAAELGL